MHYEDIQLKQSTYAIISFNERAGAEPPRAGLAVWDPPGAPHRAGGGRPLLRMYIYISLARSLHRLDVALSLFIGGINFSNVHNCEP